MTVAYLLPAALALVALFVACVSRPGLTPRTTAFGLTGASVAIAVATVWSLMLLAADFLTDALGWCRDSIRGHVHVPVLLGVASVLAVLYATVAAARSVARHHHARRGPAVEGNLLLIDTDTLIAFAVPGRHSHVVVSTGMCALLEPDEYRAMLAHEHAHLRHHHHRYITATETAAAMLPPLRFAARRVRSATERWADQDAVRVVGDPSIVARAIARAALSRSPAPGPALAISGGDVPGRIAALTATRSRRFDGVSLAIVTLLIVSGAAATVQFHHVIEFVRTFCLP